jgi:hypothetical protein
MPVGVGGQRELYARETLTLSDVSITLYRRESMTQEEVLERLVEYYQAWRRNRHGGRRY